MRRRTFLATTLASGCAAGALPLYGLTQDELTSLIVVLTGIGPDTALPQLEAVLETLVARSVPCVCVIDPAVMAPAALMPGDPLARVIRRFWDQYAGLVDVAPLVPGLQAQRPYFQSRTASLAIAQTIEMLDLSDLVQAGRRISTVVCGIAENPVGLDGLRACGIRTVLALPEQDTQGVSARLSDTGVLQLVGGRRLSLFDAAPWPTPDRMVPGNDVQILSLADYAGTAVDALTKAATRFCKSLTEAELRGDFVLSLPQDILIRDGTAFDRGVAVHVFAPSTTDPAESHAVSAFMAEARRAKLPFSTGLQPSSAQPVAGHLAFWVPQDAGRTTRAFWLSLMDRYAPGPDTPPGTCVLVPAVRGGWRGLDDSGRMILPLHPAVGPSPTSATLARAIGRTDDAILLVWPQDIATVAQRKSLLRALKAIAGDGVSHVTGLPDLVRRLLPVDALLPPYRRAEAMAPQVATVARRIPDKQRSVWLEDAEAAWSYISDLTSGQTGLCPATRDFASDNPEQYDQVTMWDVASHIHGLMAALDLRLIGEADFKQRVGRILKHLKGRRIRGLLLPPEVIASKTGRSTANFNASDTCRLLGALAHLARHRAGNAKAIKALVASWSLKDVIADGQLHSYQLGARLPVKASHYSHYSAQCLKVWGLGAASPLAGFTNPASADHKLRLLETLAQLGPFGAEPILLEALEIGMQPASNFAAQTLFAEMKATFERTGMLLCPSETPINRAPWFTYQGLQLGDAEYPWRVRPETDTANKVIAQDQRHMAVSSKAAYLWAAVYDDPHIATIVDHVRQKARMATGFASCIYVETGVSTQSYSDINTNGIILQALARILAR